MWVTREYYRGKWRNTYFDDARPAKRLMMKIIKAGGVAIAIHNRGFYETN